MKATLNNYRQSPRKVRLVADLIRGKGIERARGILRFLDKKSAGDIKKLVESATANAAQQKKAVDNLIVQDIRVDSATTLRRWRPRAFGRAMPFRRRTSRITLELGEKANAKV